METLIVKKGEELHEIPTEIIGNQQTLQTINLSNNYLLEFSNLQLPNLNVLLLQNNLLSELSEDQIKNMINIKKLDLSINKLTTIQSFHYFTSLTRIDLSRNKLISISPLCSIQSLESLSLSVNLLSEIPIEISQLKRLTTFEIDHNQLKTFPIHICECPIERIDISGNEIECFPIEITKLTTVKEMFVRNNQLSLLPKELSELTALTLFDCDHNPIQQIDWKESNSIHELLLGNVQLQSVSFISFPSLKKLIIRGNQLNEIDLHLNLIQQIQRNENSQLDTENTIETDDQNNENETVEIQIEDCQLQQIKSIGKCHFISFQNNKLTTLPSFPKTM